MTELNVALQFPFSGISASTAANVATISWLIGAMFLQVRLQTTMPSKHSPTAIVGAFVFVHQRFVLMCKRVGIVGGSILENATTALKFAPDLLVDRHTVHCLLVPIHTAHINVSVVAHVAAQFFLQIQKIFKLIKKVEHQHKHTFRRIWPL